MAAAAGSDGTPRGEIGEGGAGPRLRRVWLGHPRDAVLSVSLPSGEIHLRRQRNPGRIGAQAIAESGSASLWMDDLPGLWPLHRGVVVQSSFCEPGTLRSTGIDLMRRGRQLVLELDGGAWTICRERACSAMRRSDGSLVAEHSGEGPRLRSDGHWMIDLDVNASLRETAAALVLWRAGVFTRTRLLWVAENNAMRLPLPESG
jgi:hypothetical protein